MRIRQVKPAFWSDARIAALPAAARLFYIGLWMQADDAGWLRWDVSQIANELYGYETRKRREKDAETFLALLVASKQVVHHPCGHVEIPKLMTHQHLAVAAKQVRTIQREHAGCGGIPVETRGNLRTPTETRESPPIYGNGDIYGTEGEGNVKGNGKGNAPANTPDGAGATEIDDPTVPDYLRIVQ